MYLRLLWFPLAQILLEPVDDAVQAIEQVRALAESVPLTRIEHQFGEWVSARAVPEARSNSQRFSARPFSPGGPVTTNATRWPSGDAVRLESARRPSVCSGVSGAAASWVTAATDAISVSRLDRRRRIPRGEALR